MAWMGGAPGTHPGHVLGAAEVVAVGLFGQPVPSSSAGGERFGGLGGKTARNAGTCGVCVCSSVGPSDHR